MNKRKLDPFALSVELSGIADLSACLSISSLKYPVKLVMQRNQHNS